LQVFRNGPGIGNRKRKWYDDFGVQKHGFVSKIN